MPFLRFGRDKRGYEHTYLVHASTRRGKPGPSRILYWYRTPPGVKVGRPAFDDEARAKIELHNPGVSFDWKALESTPMPPVPEAERWRERRRVERLAKQARRADKADEPVAASEEPASDPLDGVAPEEFEVALGVGDGSPVGDAENDIVATVAVVADDEGDDAADEDPAEEISAGTSIVAAGAPPPGAGIPPSPSGRKGRRRRRGGRRHRHGSGGPGGPGGPSDAGSQDAASSSVEASSNTAGSSELVQDVPREESGE